MDEKKNCTQISASEIIQNWAKIHVFLTNIVFIFENGGPRFGQTMKKMTFFLMSPD